MWPRSWMEPSRTVSLPSSRVYEDEQPDVFAALSAAAHDFSRASRTATTSGMTMSS